MSEPPVVFSERFRKIGDLFADLSREFYGISEAVKARASEGLKGAAAPLAPRATPIAAIPAQGGEESPPSRVAPSAPAPESVRPKAGNPAYASPNFSAERDELLITRYPGEGLSGALFKAINPLPGPVVQSRQCYDRAKHLGARRDGNWRKPPSNSVEIQQNPAKAPEPPAPAVCEQRPATVVHTAPPRQVEAPKQVQPPPVKPAAPVAFAHEASPVRMAPAKPPLPVHAPAPKPIAKPAPSAVVDMPVRTPEREARVRRGVAAGETLGQMISAVNCHAGGKMTTAELQAWIAELKIAPAPKPAQKGDVRTDARRRVLEAAFNTGDAYEHIATKLNALPGARIDAKAVEAWVCELGLKRGTENLSRLLRTDFNTAIRWAVGQGLQFPAGASDKEIQTIINAEREELGLRLWQITESNRPRIGIPGHAILRRKDNDSHAA